MNKPTSIADAALNGADWAREQARQGMEEQKRKNEAALKREMELAQRRGGFDHSDAFDPHGGE